MKVPFLPKAEIKRIAEAVTFDYELKTGKSASPPVPVEDMIESGLGLRLAFENLRENTQRDDVLGATFVEGRKICADISLDRPKSEGRLCFTLAHEIGHWVMHRQYIRSAPINRGSIFCRIQDSKRPIEWQADKFASYLLMPERAVAKAFFQVWGPQTLALHNVQSCYAGPICFDPCVDNWPLIADEVRRIGNFTNVSKHAMIIRLQELGLIQNNTPAPMNWERTVPV